MTPVAVNRWAVTVAAGLALAWAVPESTAATWYWDTTTTGLWTNGANWSNNATSGGTTGTVPTNDTTTDVAYFNQSSVNGTQTVQLNADRSVSGIVVANTGATTIASDGVTPRLLTLGGGGLTVLSMANNLTLGGASNPLNLALAVSQTFANNAGSRTLTIVGGISRTSGDTTSRTLTIDGAGSTALQGVVSDGGVSGSLGLTKTGAGQLTLSAANTYTGATTVNSGTLRLDFSATGAPTSNIVNNTSNSSGLTLGGGALSVVGKASTSNSQQFNGLTLNRGASAIVATIGASGTLNLALGSVTRSVAGGVVNFTLPTTGSITTTTANANIAGGTNTILGGYATVGGTTWAVSAGDGTNPGAITGLSTYNSGFAAGTDVDVAGGASAPASMTVNSVRFNAGSPSTVTLGGPLTIATGGILLTANGNAPTIQGSTITSGNGSDLVIQHNSSGILYIKSAITGAIGLTKNGSGEVRITGSNSYTGPTTILAGQVRLGDNVFGGDVSAISPSSTIFVAAGATFAIDRLSGYTTSTATQGVQFGTIIGEGNFSVPRSGTVILNAPNTYAGTTTINGAVVQVSSIGSWSAGNTTPSSLGSPATAANGLLTLGQGAAGTLRYVGVGETTNRDVLGSTGATTFTIEQAGSGNLVFTGILRSESSGVGTQTLQLQGSTAGTGEIAGTIIDKMAGRLTGVTKGGTGTWRLSGTSNTYTGVTTINGGVLEVASLANGGVLSSTGTSSNAAANLVIDGGTLRYVGTGGSSDRNFTTGTNGGTIDASGSGALTLSGSSAFVVSNTAARLTFTGTSTAANTFSGILGDNGTGKTSLTKAGAGTWILTNANTYTGTTSINAGQLQIGSAGTINGSARVTIAGGEFRYNSATALSAPITFTAGTLSGTGTIGTAVTVGTSDILSPGNSPGSQAYTSGLTFASGGTYLWEINNWTGSAGTNYDQLVVSGSPLDITATSGSTFTIRVAGLTAGNASGAVPSFSPGTTGTTFTIATSAAGITGFDQGKFTLDATSAFTNNNPLPTNAGFWLSTNGGSTSLILNYAPSATYNLSAAASAAAIRVGGTSTITATVTSSTATLINPDSMAFIGLALSGSLGTLSSTSGTLAGGESGSGNAAFTTLATGSYTFTPSLTSATNVNIGSNANAGTTSAATVTVYNPASASSLSGTTVVLGNVHVGGSFGTQSISISNTGTAAAAFQEGLAGSFTSATGDASGSGSFGNLFTGSASTAISVGLGNASTATAGVKSGTVTLGFTSTGTTSGGATGLDPLPLASQTVAVTGTVWNYAAANSISGTVNLGTVLKGTPLSQTLSITNTAPNDGFSEKLDAAFGTLTGGVTTNSGSISLLAAGGTSSAMSIYLASGSAGTATGAALVNFTSNGLGTSDLGTTSLASQTVSVEATVLDPAVASFTSGSTATTSLLLDFGSVQQNASASPLGFNLYNLMQTSGFTADLALLSILSGTGNTGAITTTLTGTFNNLAAATFNGYTVALATDTLGAFTNTYTLSFKSAFGGAVYGGDTSQILTLTVQGIVVVPEPGALALAGIGVAAFGWAAARRRRRGQAARRK